NGAGIADDRLTVALAIVVGIHKEVEDPSDQTLIVDDVVRRWRGLDSAERERYFDDENPRFSSLMQFAWEYVEEMECLAYVEAGDPYGEDDCECARVAHWRRYVQQLRTPVAVG